MICCKSLRGRQSGDHEPSAVELRWKADTKGWSLKLSAEESTCDLHLSSKSKWTLRAGSNPPRFSLKWSLSSYQCLLNFSRNLRQSSIGVKEPTFSPPRNSILSRQSLSLLILENQTSLQVATYIELGTEGMNLLHSYSTTRGSLCGQQCSSKTYSDVDRSRSPLLLLQRLVGYDCGFQ